MSSMHRLTLWLIQTGWAQSSKETIQELSAVGALRSGGGQNPISASLVHSGESQLESSFTLYVLVTDPW